MKNLKYFSAAWCGPCKTFKPIIEEISSEGHSVQFIDIDTSSDLAERYNVRSVPTVVVEENGIEIDRFIGTQSVDEQAMVGNNSKHNRIHHSILSTAGLGGMARQALVEINVVGLSDESHHSTSVLL